MSGYKKLHVKLGILSESSRISLTDRLDFLSHKLCHLLRCPAHEVTGDKDRIEIDFGERRVGLQPVE